METLEFTHKNISSIAEEVLSPVFQAEPAKLLFTANTDHLRMLQRDASFRTAYSMASIVTADGVPIFLQAKMSGKRVHHVTGSDLLVAICSHKEARKRRFAFVCSTNETARLLSTRLLSTGFLSENLLFIVPPFGFDDDHSTAGKKIVTQLQSFKPSHIIMGVGAPKSEIWTSKHRNDFLGAWCCCFGAGVDYLAGTKRRAPYILRVSRLEWFWRFLIEPARLGPRYASGALYLARTLSGTLRR